MKDLSTLFTNNQVMLLEGYARLDDSVAAKNLGEVGSRWSVKVAALKRIGLHLRLDGKTYVFTEARGQVECVLEAPAAPAAAELTTITPPLTVSVHLDGDRSLSLVNEVTGQTVIEIGDTLQCRLDLLDRLDAPARATPRRATGGYRFKVGR